MLISENHPVLQPRLTFHHTEPVSNSAPKVPAGAQGATFYFRAASAVTLHCTGQGYPVPTFR